MKQSRITLCIAMVMVLSVVVTMGIFANPGGPPVEFTADFRSVEAGKTFAGQYFFGNPGVRMEGRESGGPLVITMFVRSTNKIINLMPDHRMYMEIPFDPDNLAFLSAGSETPTACGVPGEATLLGRETLHGRAVEKWRCVPKDGTTMTEPMTVWYDTRLQSHIRVERDNGGQWELTNIQERRVDPNLFEIPAGYSSPFGGLGGMFGGGGGGMPQPPPGGMPQMPGGPPPRSR